MQISQTSVKIPLEVGRLDGTLSVPETATGIVLFAHGSGSSHQSPRNKLVATRLQEHGVATVLFDLLTPVEDSRHSNRFNVELLTERLQLATHWIAGRKELASLPLGYFGASTGAAAALRAAAQLGARIKAVVSRGGRPDLAGNEALREVKSPTLLVVGGRDTAVLALNRETLSKLQCEKQMRVIPGATHLFEEPGTLEQVAAEAASWFNAHFKQ